jgi:diguanylate cyclase (GGDEF)-like protein/PAS domain S-box-containing protein
MQKSASNYLSLEEISMLTSKGQKEKWQPFALQKTLDLPSIDLYSFLAGLDLQEDVALLLTDKQKARKAILDFALVGFRQQESLLVLVEPQLEHWIREILEAIQVPQGRLFLLSSGELTAQKPKVDPETLAERVLLSFDGKALQNIKLRLVHSLLEQGESDGQSIEYSQECLNALRRKLLISNCLRLFPYSLSLTEQNRVLAYNSRIIIDESPYYFPCSQVLNRRANQEEEVADLGQSLQVAHEAVQKQHLLEALFLGTSQPILIGSTEGRILISNPAFAGLSGYAEQELKFMPFIEQLVPEDWQAQNQASFAELFKYKRNQDYETEILKKDGSRVTVQILLDCIELKEGSVWFWNALIKDITDRKLAEKQLFRSSFQNTVSGLPNKALLLNRLDFALAKLIRKDDYRFALLFLDADNKTLEHLNLGHKAWDELVKVVGKRLHKSLRSIDTLAQLNGNQFAVLLDELEDSFDAFRIARRVLQEISSPIRTRDYEVGLNYSIGIVFGSAAYELPEHVLRDAQNALYRAREKGPRQIEVFDRQLHQQAVHVMQLEEELQNARNSGQLVLSYQPVVDLQKEKICGAEALLRWQHPQRGELYPEDFMALAEHTAIITEIDNWVLEEACSQLGTWLDIVEEPSKWFVSVNLSRKTLQHSNLVNFLDGLLAEHKLGSKHLKLELQENDMQGDGEHLQGLFAALKKLGLDIFFDHFGSNSSSLVLVHKVPIQALKMDSSCLQNLNMAQNIVTLARELELGIIVEGIENESQVEECRKLGCDYAQGRFFYPPLKKEKLSSLLSGK